MKKWIISLLAVILLLQGCADRDANAKEVTDTEKKKAMRRIQNLYDRIYKRWQNKNCQPILSSIEDYFMAKAEDKN